MDILHGWIGYWDWQWVEGIDKNQEAAGVSSIIVNTGRGHLQLNFERDQIHLVEVETSCGRS